MNFIPTVETDLCPAKMQSTIRRNKTKTKKLTNPNT